MIMAFMQGRASIAAMDQLEPLDFMSEQLPEYIQRRLDDCLMARLLESQRLELEPGVPDDQRTGRLAQHGQETQRIINNIILEYLNEINNISR